MYIYVCFYFNILMFLLQILWLFPREMDELTMQSFPKERGTSLCNQERDSDIDATQQSDCKYFYHVLKLVQGHVYVNYNYYFDDRVYD